MGEQFESGEEKDLIKILKEKMLGGTYIYRTGSGEQEYIIVDITKKEKNPLQNTWDAQTRALIENNTGHSENIFITYEYDGEMFLLELCLKEKYEEE